MVKFFRSIEPGDGPTERIAGCLVVERGAFVVFFYHVLHILCCFLDLINYDKFILVLPVFDVS